MSGWHLHVAVHEAELVHEAQDLQHRECNAHYGSLCQALQHITQTQKFAIRSNSRWPADTPQTAWQLHLWMALRENRLC